MASRRLTRQSIALLTFSLAVLSLGSCAQPNLTPINDGCICPGSSLLLNCTTVGDGATAWLGSIFMGTGCNQFFLSHGQFNPNGLMFCPGHLISARPLVVIDDCYTSQFNVTNVDAFIGKNVVCRHDAVSGASSTIGNYTINLTTEPSPPPNDVSLTGISSSGLAFRWTNVAPNCSSIFYNISSSGCGSCPTNTSSTSFVCSGVHLSGASQECSVRVRAITCDSLAGNYSELFTATLQGPPAPNVTVLPTYSQTTSSLLSFLVTVEEQAPISISGNDVIVQNYAINYRDSSDTECGSITLRSGDQRLREGVEVNMTSSCTIDADSALTVDVVATNILGMGPATTSRIAGSVEGFVRVTSSSTDNTITCKFSNQPTSGSGQTSCTVSYGLCGGTLNETARDSSSSNIVKVRLDLPDPALYCYSVSASNGSFTVAIEGSISSSGDRPEATGTTDSSSTSPPPQSKINGAVIGGVFGALVFLIVVVVVVLVVSLVGGYRKLKERKSASTPGEAEEQQNEEDDKKALEAGEGGGGGGQTIEMQSLTTPPQYENVPTATPNLSTPANGMEDSSLLLSSTPGTISRQPMDAERKLAEHKNQIPVTIERADYEETLKDIKKSYWFPESCLVSKFEKRVRRLLEISTEEPLFLIVGNKTVLEGTTRLNEIDKAYWQSDSDDKFLHIAYSSRDPNSL